MGLSATVELSPNSSGEPDLSVELVSDPDSFVDMEPVWNDLLEKAGIDHPFLTHQWVRTWWESFGNGKTLHILLVKAAEEPIAIAPLMLTRRKFYGMPVRCLEFIANVHTPRCDFVVGRRTNEAYRAIWTAIGTQKRLWDVMLLCQVPSDSNTVDEIRRFAGQEGLPCHQWVSGDSPYVPVQKSWDDYFKQLSAKHRANVSRRLRRLSEIGEVEMESIWSTSEMKEALEEGFRIEGAAWKDHIGTSIHSQPDSRLFYSRLAERFAQMGWLRLYFLTVAGRRIAFHYSVSYGKRVYLLKPGYDPDFARFSPVNVLCFLFLKDAFRNGLQEFDLLGVADDWKLQWTSTVRGHYWMFVFSKRLVPSLICLTKFHVLPHLRTTQIFGVLLRAIGCTKRMGKHQVDD